MLFRIARASCGGLGLACALSLSACHSQSLTSALGSGAAMAHAAPAAAPVAVSAPQAVTAPRAVTAPDASASTDNCPRSSDLPGQRPETYTGSNNSPFSARTDPEPTDCEIARENHHKWTRLVGYSVDEASRRAKSAGWEGKVEVRPLREYDARCKDGMVCTFDPARWEIGEGSTLVLYVNHKMTISTPD